MFIDNLGTLDKKMLLDSVPKFDESQMYYFRREAGNYISFAVKNGKTQELMMNCSAWEILRLCNGKKSILEIEEEYRERYAYMNSNANFLKDIITTLYVFDKIWLISWEKGGSPFMLSAETGLENGYTLTWAKENEIRAIVETYDKYVGYSGYYIYNCPNNKFKGLNEYQKETSVRSKLFFFKEDFFILKNKEREIVGVISVSNDHPDTDIVEITTLIVPDNMVETVLLGLEKILKENYLFNLSKLRLKVISSNDIAMNYASYENCGFIKTAALKNEYGSGNDLIFFDYFFEGVNRDE